jgi:hypothetical protein
MLAQLYSLYLGGRWHSDCLPSPDVPSDRSSDDHPFRNDSNEEGQSMVGVIARKWIDTLHH